VIETSTRVSPGSGLNHFGNLDSLANSNVDSGKYRQPVIAEPEMAQRTTTQRPTCVRVYLEDFKNSEDKELRWGVFQKIAKGAGIPTKRLGKLSVGVLTETQADTLESLWKAQLKLSKK
jgi:hypothetical protein